MKKSLLLTFAACTMASGLWAAPLSPEQALQRATMTTRGGNAGNLRLAFTGYQSNGEAALYVFNKNSAEGYLLVSADDCAMPVLGYADEGSFKESEMSPTMKWWLSEYARQIEYAVANGGGTYVPYATRADRKAIAPMIKSKWNQNSPYNDMTPTVNGQHCVTGCVATSTAQVMNYWKYPEIGTGSSTAYVYGNDGSETEVSMNYSEQKFDWANMLDVYNSNATEAQKNAVAYLMKAAGYGVHMSYTSNESGAGSLYVAGTLVENFKYNKNLRYCERNYFNATDWDNMLYQELAEGRPIVYGGSSTEGGHSFVCDGYNTDGYYHFNWGWGGMSDGYFAINALNPMSLGIGANGGGYNFHQDIVIGIQPETGPYKGVAFELDALTGSMSGNKLSLNVEGLYNYSGMAQTFAMGATIEPVAPTTGTVKTVMFEQYSNLTLDVLYGWQEVSFDVAMGTSLANGTYKVTLCYQKAGTSEWLPVEAPNNGYNYVLVTKNNNKFSVQNNKTLSLSVTGGGLLSELIYGQGVKVSMKVKNGSDRELTQPIYPILYDGDTPVMMADGLVLTVAGGQEVTKEFDCIFTLLHGATAPTSDHSYTLYFYDPTYSDLTDTPPTVDFFQGFSRTVTMKVGEAPNLIVNDFTMPGLNTEEGTYIVTDVEAIPFTVTIENKGGYFANNVEVLIYKQVGSQNYFTSVANGLFPSIVDLKQGESKTMTNSFSFPDLEDALYLAEVMVNGKILKDKNGNESQIVFRIRKSGIGDVMADESLKLVYNKENRTIIVKGSTEISSIEIYSLDGSRKDVNVVYSGDEATADINMLPKGVYIVKASDKAKQSRTIKIIR